MSAADARLPCFERFAVEPCTPRSLIPAADLTPHAEAMSARIVSAVSPISLHNSCLALLEFGAEAANKDVRALNPMAREFQLPVNPRNIKLNPCATEFKSDAPRPVSPTLNIAAPIFKPCGLASCVQEPPEEPLAEQVHLNSMTSLWTPSPPPDANLQKQLDLSVTSKAAADERIANLLRDIKASGSRETALVTELTGARTQAAETLRELGRVKVSAGLLKLELETTRRAHNEELRTARRADAHEMTVLRDARDELLSQKEQLEHQLHFLRRELALEKNRAIAGANKSETTKTLQALLSNAHVSLSPQAQAQGTFFPASLPIAGTVHNPSGQMRPGLFAPLAVRSQHIPFATASVVPQPRRAASVLNTAPIAKRVFQKQMGVDWGRPKESAQTFAREMLKPFRPGQQAVHVPSHQRFD